MARLPWYAFLYRLFGAQGTFWLWIVCLIALWWTAKPTLHRLANRQPATGLLVADVATTRSATDLTRWVALTGVEVAYDPELLGQRSTGSAPVRVLLDARDPAARWWTATRQIADAVLSPEEADAARARKLLEDRYALLEGDLARNGEWYPEPERVLVIQNGAPPARPSPFPSHPTDPWKLVAWMQARIEARAALVRERVKPDVSIEGLLVPMPETLGERVKAQVDINVGRWVIQQGKKPRDLESWIFAVAAILLLFLGTGFYGAVRTRRVADL